MISNDGRRRCVAELPAEVLEAVVARLNAHDTVRLGATCRGFRALAREATPGLRLSLYPHQARSWRVGFRRSQGNNEAYHGEEAQGVAPLQNLGSCSLRTLPYLHQVGLGLVRETTRPTMEKRLKGLPRSGLLLAPCPTLPALGALSGGVGYREATSGGGSPRVTAPRASPGRSLGHGVCGCAWVAALPHQALFVYS